MACSHFHFYFFSIHKTKGKEEVELSHAESTEGPGALTWGMVGVMCQIQLLRGPERSRGGQHAEGCPEGPSSVLICGVTLQFIDAR